MRTYVCTLGYHSTRVTRPVLDNGINSGDRIVLLRPTEDDDEDGRAEQAVDDIREMASTIDPESRVETAQLRTASFTETVRDCLALLTDAEGDTIAVFGGGPREVFLPFTVAVCTRRDLVTEALQFRDMDGVVSEVPVPDLLARVPSRTDPTLALIDDLGGETTLPELSAASDHSKSTVGRHLDELEAAGLVSTESEGQTRLIGLTLTGELHLSRG